MRMPALYAITSECTTSEISILHITEECLVQTCSALDWNDTFGIHVARFREAHFFSQIIGGQLSQHYLTQSSNTVGHSYLNDSTKSPCFQKMTEVENQSSRPFSMRLYVNDVCQKEKTIYIC